METTNWFFFRGVFLQCHLWGQQIHASLTSMKAKIGSQNYELQEVGTVKTDGGGKGTKFSKLPKDGW